MAIITAILIILAVLAVIILLILLVPFHISLLFSKDGGEIKGFFELRWFKIRIIRREFPEEKEKEEKKTKAIEKEKAEPIKEEEKEKEKPSKLSKWEWEDIKRTLLLLWESFPHFLNFLITVLKSINLEKIDFHLVLGLNSPVDTAKTMGYFWAAVSLINISQKIHISGEPTFVEEKMDVNGDVSFNVRLFNPFIGLLKLLTKISVLKLLWELRRLR